MTVTQSRQIPSCDDYELHIKRANLLNYKVSYLPNTPISTILFIIPGFGNDANPEYLDKLRIFAAETFSVAVVTVEYHCMYARFENNASIDFDPIDIEVLQEISMAYEIDYSELKEININTVLEHLNQSIQTKKEKGKISPDQKVMVPMTLIPPNNDYQNFGLMQAIDHINVYYDLLNTLHFISPSPNTVFLGSSHGGYIAHMIAKIAPHIVSCVIDNSCYVKPPLKYIVGKETDITEPESPLFFESYPHLIGHGFTLTLWTTNSKSPYHFSSDRYRIRNLTDNDHIKLALETHHRKPIYIAYHSAQDVVAPARDKIDFYNELVKQGYQATLHLIHSEEQIDGKLIKNLTHAMDMSLKELIRTELPNVLDRISNDQSNIPKAISFPCDSLTYKFEKIDNRYQFTCVSSYGKIH